MHKSLPIIKRPIGLQAGGAFLCSEAWQSGLSRRAYPRRTFGHPNPSQGPVSSNLTASTIEPVGPPKGPPRRGKLAAIGHSATLPNTKTPRPLNGGRGVWFCACL